MEVLTTPILVTTVRTITKYSSNNLELGLWMEAERMLHPNQSNRCRYTKRSGKEERDYV
jgi:hypothetical protein